MTKTFGTLLLVFLMAGPVAAETPEDLDKWFREAYAALYVENAWDKAEEFREVLADEIAYRSDEGLLVTNADGFLIDQLDVWCDEGWVGTDVEDLKTALLNKTTAVFDIKWHDRNDDGSVEHSCGLYVADKVDGKWLLSQYITKACVES